MNRFRKKFHPVSQVIGMTIRDIDEKRVGVANELLIDVDEGRVAYLRIRLQSGAESGDWYVTVPWSAVTDRGVDSRYWQLSVRQRTLARMARQETDSDSGTSL